MNLNKILNRGYFEQAGENGVAGGGGVTSSPAPAGTDSPGTAQPAPSGPMSDNDLTSLFNFDPFKGTAGEADPQRSPAPAAVPTPETVPQGAQEVAPAAVATGLPTLPDSTIPATLAVPGAVPAPAAPVAQSPEMQMLVQQNQMLQQQMQQVLAQQAPPQAEAQVAQAPQVQITPEIMQAIDSEDSAVRMQGMQAMAQTMAQNILAQTQVQQDAMYSAIPELMQQQQAEQAEAQRIESDFYTTHADLNKPDLRPLVLAQAQQVMQEMGYPQWSPVVRDAAAQRVRAILGQAAPAQVAAPVPGQVPAPQMNVIPQAQPPGMTQMGAGAGQAGSAGQTQQAQLDDFFG